MYCLISESTHLTELELGPGGRSPSGQFSLRLCRWRDPDRLGQVGGSTGQFSLGDRSLKPSQMFSTVSILCSATKIILIRLEALFCRFTNLQRN